MTHAWRRLKSQGRCVTCNVLHFWPRGSLLVRDAKCPTCGNPLARTTHVIARRVPALDWPQGLGVGAPQPDIRWRR